MILKDIAERIGMDISTVSRVANSKYVQTPYGTLSLKWFFSEGVTTDSGEEEFSEVKKILQDAIAEEDKRKPLDEKLGVLLNAKGYNIARRTVAKYREQLGIPVARLEEGTVMKTLAKLVVLLHPLCMPLLTLAMLLSEDGYLKHRMGLFSYLFVLLLVEHVGACGVLVDAATPGHISDPDIARARSAHGRFCSCCPTPWLTCWS